MPSAYCVIYAHNANTGPIVLTATKNINVPNNPGQVVFPGGRVDVNESATDAAVREFYEETGVRIDLDNGVIDSTSPVTILQTNVINFPGAPAPTTYSALYLQVAGLPELNRVLADIKINIKNGHVDDKELDTVEVMTNRQAYATFFNEDDINNPKKRTEWFMAISRSLPEA